MATAVCRVCSHDHCLDLLAAPFSGQDQPASPLLFLKLCNDEDHQLWRRLTALSSATILSVHTASSILVAELMLLIGVPPSKREAAAKSLCPHPLKPLLRAAVRAQQVPSIVKQQAWEVGLEDLPQLVTQWVFTVPCNSLASIPGFTPTNSLHIIMSWHVPCCVCLQVHLCSC